MLRSGTQRDSTTRPYSPQGDTLSVKDTDKNKHKGNQNPVCDAGYRATVQAQGRAPRTDLEGMGPGKFLATRVTPKLRPASRDQPRQGALHML